MVVVVDNGSRPDAIGHLRAHLPQTPLLTQGANTGFGPAANAGFRHLLAMPHLSYLVVAPHDARPHEGCLADMVDLLDRRPAIGLVSADVGDEEVPLMDRYLGAITMPARTAAGWEPSDYPHGTLLMARRECLLDVGLFDERYFAYCEEADLGMRATRAGWGVGLLRGARVTNTSMRSGSAAVDYLQQRNTLLLLREHFGRYNAFIRSSIAIGELVWGLARPSARPPLFSPSARVRALLDFLTRRLGPPPEEYFEELDERGDPVATAL